MKHEYGRDQKDANEAVETVSKKVNKAKKDIKSHTEGKWRFLNALSDNFQGLKQEELVNHKKATLLELNSFHIDEALDKIRRLVRTHRNAANVLHAIHEINSTVEILSLTQKANVLSPH